MYDDMTLKSFKHQPDKIALMKYGLDSIIELLLEFLFGAYGTVLKLQILECNCNINSATILKRYNCVRI